MFHIGNFLILVIIRNTCNQFPVIDSSVENTSMPIHNKCTKNYWVLQVMPIFNKFTLENSYESFKCFIKPQTSKTSTIDWTYSV